MGLDAGEGKRSVCWGGGLSLSVSDVKVELMAIAVVAEVVVIVVGCQAGECGGVGGLKPSLEIAISPVCLRP